MANALMTKFNERTGGEFDYLVLESVDADIKSECLRINLIFPEPKEKEVRENSDRIKDAMAFILLENKSKANIEVKLTKSHFDYDFFKAKLVKFFENYPSVAPYIYVGNIEITKIAQYDFAVKVNVDEDIFGMVERRGIAAEVKKMLAMSYCEKVAFEFAPMKSENKTDYIELAEEELRSYVYQTSGGHFIVPENVEEFVGKIIYDRAGYISDAKREMSSAVYCGKVSEFTECTRKPKEGETETRKFYKFTITDPTGSLKCLHFPRKKEGETNIVNLRDGKDVVVKGSLKENRFRGQVSYDMFVNSISLCTIPEDLVIEINEFVAPREYRMIKPEKFVEVTQANFFDVKTEPSKWLMGKEFCVFDVETTGFDMTVCKIIELAAVRVKDGVITETFSTFLNPHELLEQRIIDLTHITDADVKDAPDIADVLPDFYKFAENTTLVGHNVNFDVGFINAAGKPYGIFFNNPIMDTLELSQRYLKGLRNYKLGTVVKALGVVNEQAHRAIYDTIATAKAFIKLADYM